MQKQGSVGEINRRQPLQRLEVRGYDELRHDLARTFGIQGQLEDSLTSDRKLVCVTTLIMKKIYFLSVMIHGSK